ncbi:MAG: ClpXP protease specificity-enhancing factor [Sulfuritalea sp.]|nr:ClpXP protease specificity-enhancing factor [Sulfuritalea sp.]
MASTKPYLIRAIRDWCADEGLTPYLVAQVDARTRIPREFVRDGQIVLNIGAEATRQLLLGNEEITFQTRFNGASFPVLVPVDAVAAIYARENGQGMAFEATPGASPADADGKVGAGETAAAEAADVAESETEPAAKRGGHLTLVK